jgi:hypothetical protein
VKIQYEKGDVVFSKTARGALIVVAVRKKGLTVSNGYGEMFYLGKLQVEPAPHTLTKAKWLEQNL